MPAGDGTGPMGMGPMTGRGAGYCAGYTVPGFANPIPGRGWGMGYGWGRGGGRGRGWRHRFYATGQPFWARQPMPVNQPMSAPFAPAFDETEMLKAQAAQMEQTLNEIRKRIAEIEATQTQEN